MKPTVDLLRSQPELACAQCGEVGHVVCAYEGYFSSTMITAMTQTLKKHLEEADVTSGVKRKLFSSFVEMSQNIVHYAAPDYQLAPSDRAGVVRYGAISLSLSCSRYRLCCINPVHASAVGSLQQKLERLRGLSLDEIKREYKASLRSQAPVDSKGAGLGLLTVARDASAPLAFSFVPMPDSSLVLFHLQIII